MKNTKNTPCRICNSIETKQIYTGPIRSGGIDSATVDGYEILQCNKCGFASLNPIPENQQEFYENDEYRRKFFYETAVETMRKKYDHEQNARINRVGVQSMRGKIVADFGAGPGLFLDAIQGIAGKTIAVEPSRLYRDHFLSRGHKHFSYSEELIASLEKVDVAVSFDTIEHISDIRGFVRNVYESLVDKGTFYLSMPNHEDIIRLICPETYEPFFYQISHLNYFNGYSARLLLENAGFKDISVSYLHKYNINNIIQWSKKGLPGVFNTGTAFDEHFHNIYVAEIERMGIASHLWIKSCKND